MEEKVMKKSNISKRHLGILKKFLDREIDAENIQEKDKKIIMELCIARKKQIQKKIFDSLKKY